MYHQGEKTAFPLCWPDGRPRAPYRRINRNFKSTFARARDNCIAEIRRLGGSEAIISTNIRIKRDGMPEAVDFGKVIPDPGVAVYFKRNGKQLCFACDCWQHVEDNMHAIALTIQALRGIARWGTGDMMEAAFRGFTALPENASGWWETLGVTVNASEEQVKEAYRALVKKHHPDAGGDSAEFIRIQKAWQQFETQKRGES